MSIQNKPMMEKYVTISWCPADVKELYPHWSDEQCMQALEVVGGTLEDRSIEEGWLILETALQVQYPED